MILDEIAEKTRIRVAGAKQKISPEEMKQKALACEIHREFPFEKELRKKGISFICEVKKASPSKGIIAEKFDYRSIAESYEEAGAGAISVLTEPEYFKGSIEYLKEIAEDVKIPLLRKDFTVDEYMIYEAKAAGASIVLLICAILDNAQLKAYLELTKELGLDALVEAHDEWEADRALNLEAKIIGVNNRNLHDFTVDKKKVIRDSGTWRQILQ